MNKFEILDIVKKYYPIGLPYCNEEYDGYAQLKKIIELKINSIIAGSYIEKWDNMLHFIDENYDWNVVDLSASQTPSISLLIILKDNVDSFIRRRSEITLSISLLDEIYTIALRDTFTLSEKTTEYNRIDTYTFSRYLFTEREQRIINELNSTFNMFFGKYEFIEMKHLIRKVIGGRPFGEDSLSGKTEFSLFDFLFGI